MPRRTGRPGCPSDGQLRTSFDQGPVGEWERHIADCSRCAKRVDELRMAARFARDAMGRTVSNLDANGVDVSIAMAWFKGRIATEDYERRQQQPAGFEYGGSWMSTFWMQRGSRAAAAMLAIIVMVASFTLSPMRTVADGFLDQFRVQKFAAVTIPMDLVEPLQSGMLQSLSAGDKERIKQELDVLGTFETTFQLDMSSLPSATTVEDAETQFGDIAVPDELPDGFGSPTAYVTEAGSATYVLNVDRAREITEALNLPIYAFDQVTADTLTFTANVSPASVLRYRNGSTNIIIGQTASPTLDIPEGFDMDALREDILRFPGLPIDLVAQLRSIDDWESTLIVPIPEHADSRDVTVNGNAGLLIEMEQGAVVLWEDDGVLYAVAGQVSADDVLDIADSMN